MTGGMDDDAAERRHGILALEAPPRRFPGRKRILAIAALPGAVPLAAGTFPGGNG